MDDNQIEIKRKRVFDPSESSDGLRVLVDRFWPRGIKKADLDYDVWAKDITPSDELRRMFHADPENHWNDFAEGYRRELQSSDAFTDFVNTISAQHPQCVTLLYAFRNKERNHALILQEELIRRLNEVHK
jgi:uncharacterized protein YeaO (DUF488 family)